MNLHLSKGELNKTYTLVSIGTVDKPLYDRLSELGFVKGAKLTIIAFSMRKKTLLVSVYGSMFALKSSVAEQMVVKI